MNNSDYANKTVDFINTTNYLILKRISTLKFQILVKTVLKNTKDLINNELNNVNRRGSTKNLSTAKELREVTCL